MEINKIYNENCLETMAKMPDNFIDLTVTSPPYDDLRTYNGYCFDFENVAKELFRVTKEGGVIVWVVGDSSIGGGESCSSFKQALFFVECGFILNDTMIYAKPNRRPRQYRANRYEQIFEYMFVFVKGDKCKIFNPINEVCLNKGKEIKFTSRDARRENNFTAGGVMTTEKTTIVKDTKRKGNIWEYANNTTGINHPAIFPEQLANDHIISWSNETDLIYDPFMGSGTTAKMAILNNRKYIGSEISEEYCKIIETRIKECGGLFFNYFETELSNEAGT